MLASAPASAQEEQLRGGIGDDEPVLAQETGSGSLFGETASEDPFADSGLSAESPTQTARNRPGQPAADRPEQDAGLRLDDEEDETLANVRAGRLDALDDERNVAIEPENQRATPIGGANRSLEENPYAPLGLRLGTFLVTSSLEQGLGWTSNADSSPEGSSAVFSETTLRLNAVSDWSRHSAAVNAYGTLRESISGAEISDPQAGIDGDFSFELGNDYRAIAALGYDLRRESATSPVDLPPTTSRPLRHTLTGAIGLEKDSGKFRFGLRGNVERLMFGDAELQGGGTLSQRERNSTLAAAVLRGGYEVSPAIIPFVEAEVGRRFYDQELDSDGFARSANRYGLRAGVALDMGEKLNGELSAGWITEELDDERLAAISGASINADLFWSPVRGTRVGLQAATTVEGTTTAGETGSILYSGQISLEREMRANLTGTAVFGAQWRDYVGSDGRDLTVSAEAGVTWWLNRYAGLIGRARHEIVESSLPDRDSETTSVFLGMKLQR